MHIDQMRNKEVKRRTDIKRVERVTSNHPIIIFYTLHNHFQQPGGVEVEAPDSQMSSWVQILGWADNLWSSPFKLQPLYTKQK